MLKRFLVATMAALVVIVASATFASTPNYATTGVIFDFGRRNIVGIWVDVENGRDGWAEWRTIGGSNNVSWNYDNQSKPFRLFIGVGGTPADWGRSVETPWISRRARTVRVEIIYYPHNDTDYPRAQYWP